MSPLYEVTVTREATFFVDAPDKLAAQSDADELSSFREVWDAADDMVSVSESRLMTPLNGWDLVWVGGEDGSWCNGDDYVTDMIERELEEAQ